MILEGRIFSDDKGPTKERKREKERKKEKVVGQQRKKEGRVARNHI